MEWDRSFHGAREIGVGVVDELDQSLTFGSENELTSNSRDVFWVKCSNHMMAIDELYDMLLDDQRMWYFFVCDTMTSGSQQCQVFAPLL